MTLRYSRKLKFEIAKQMVGIGIEQAMVRMGLIKNALKLNYSQAAMQAKLNATTTIIGNAGVLEIRDGTQPAGPDTTATGTLGASFTMGSPFGSGASAAIPSVLSPTLPSNVNASNSITPTWFRIKTSGGTAHIDGSAGASGCNMTIGALTATQPVSITSFTITSGDSGH